MTKRQRGGNDEQGLLVEGLRSFGGVAALILGAVYLAGILLKTVDLDNAGISPRDALPLLPLELILRTGLTLVAPVLGLVALLGSVMAIGALYEKQLRRITMLFKQAELDRVSDGAWLEKYEKAENEADWDVIKAQINVALQAAKTEGDRERVKLVRRQRLAFYGFDVILILSGMVIAVITILALPLPLIIASFAGMMALVGASRFIREQRVVRVLGIYYALVAAMLVVYLLAYPRPLSIARIATDNEGVVSGRLIVMSDSNWYVGTDGGVVRALSQDHVKCVVIEPQATAPNTLLLEIVGRDAPSPQALNCR